MKKTKPTLIIFLLLSGILFLYFKPSGNEVKARVNMVNNDEVLSSGVGRLGRQKMEVELLNKEYKDQVFQASNHLSGNLEIDNFYKEGDIVLVAVLIKDEEIINVNAVDLYRWPWEVGLFFIFFTALLIYAGSTGIRALISFLASVWIIWKVLITGFLSDWPPLLLTFAVLILLSAIILFSIAGFTKKGFSAFLGTLAGLTATGILTMVFGQKMGLFGMTGPFAQTLLIKGYMDLNMQQIFFSSIILGASGAAMDIAMDISASIEEIYKKKPGISLKELIQSGFNIGRAVIGTMTTTLLLAYSGGSLTMLMLFSSQNTSFSRIMNFKLVSAEVLRILSGSIGLVLVAPLTAVIASWIMVSGFSMNFHKFRISRNTR
ncbi:MAG: YibE/F family protein [bacterium]|nr:YibE/F family protein [bacterium]